MPLIHSLEIAEVDYSALTDDDIVVLNAFENVIQSEELPDDPPRTIAATDGEARNIPGFIGFREFWARDRDASLAGMGYGYWRKAEENRHLMRAWVGVRPDHRRRGLGRDLLARVVQIAEDEDRSLLQFGVSDRVPAGKTFAEKFDARPAIATHTNRLVLASLDRSLVDRWIAEGPGRATGYSVFGIDGPYPDDLVEAAADLAHVMNTAPRDDLDMEDERITVEQVRENERSMVAQETERWSLFARHDATGELVGFTEVTWNPERPQTVSQQDTGVRPEHRGHALGKWLKAAMLRRVLDERPGVVDIRTGNADSNDAMLGINRAMGFEPYLGYTWYQVPVERVRSYLGSST